MASHWPDQLASPHTADSARSAVRALLDLAFGDEAEDLLPARRRSGFGKCGRYQAAANFVVARFPPHPYEDHGELAAFYAWIRSRTINGHEQS
jgi:hypothetical protein